MLKPAFAGLSRFANALAIASNALGTLTVLALVVILNVDVVARGLFNAPLKGAYELVQFSVVLIVFLQLPDVVRVDRLTRSDGFLLMIGRRSASTGRSVRRIINALSAILMGLITYIMLPEFLHMWQTQDYFGVPGLFTLPWWPLKLVITFGCGLACLIFTIKVITGRDRHDAVLPGEAPE